MNENAHSIKNGINSYKAEQLATSPINKALRAIFIVGILRPIFWLIFGLNRFDRLKVPTTGPFILAPNHNSHLDVLIIAALLPLKHSMNIKTAAAADYFWKFWLSRWFVFGLFGSIPVWRNSGSKKSSVVDALDSALKGGCPVLIFPEGTRGKPEVMETIKGGIVRLGMENPKIPIIPIYCSGAGKALPKGSKILVPIHPKIVSLDWIFAGGKDTQTLTSDLEQAYKDAENQVSHQTTKSGGNP